MRVTETEDTRGKQIHPDAADRRGVARPVIRRHNIFQNLPETSFATKFVEASRGERRRAPSRACWDPAAQDSPATGPEDRLGESGRARGPSPESAITGTLAPA